MQYRRGTWHCEAGGCGDDAELAFIVIVSTPGKRGVRRQASSSTVRLCSTDTKQMLKGKMPPLLLTRIDEAIKKVKGER